MGSLDFDALNKMNKSNSWPEPQNDKIRQQQANTANKQSELGLDVLRLYIGQNINVVS